MDPACLLELLTPEEQLELLDEYRRQKEREAAAARRALARLRQLRAA